jgi:hypothetical protein
MLSRHSTRLHWQHLRPAHGLVVVALLTPAACGDPFALPDGSFHGHYTFAFEASAFRPCGADASWWVSGDLDPVFAFFGPLPPGEAARAFVRWHGELSGKGRYGHLGAYERELTVTEVIEVRTPAPDDCH